MKKVILLAAILLISACATVGNQFDMSKIDQIKIGQTTQQEVVTLLGQPLSISRSGDGHTFLGYSYVHTEPGSTESQLFSVSIGPDGKVENTFSHSQKQ